MASSSRGQLEGRVEAILQAHLTEKRDTRLLTISNDTFNEAVKKLYIRSFGGRYHVRCKHTGDYSGLIDVLRMELTTMIGTGRLLPVVNDVMAKLEVTRSSVEDISLSKMGFASLLAKEEVVDQILTCTPYVSDDCIYDYTFEPRITVKGHLWGGCSYTLVVTLDVLSVSKEAIENVLSTSK